MLDWIREHPSMSSIKDFHVVSSYGLYGLGLPSDSEPNGLQNLKPLFFGPSIGDHWIRHQGHWLQITRQRQDSVGGALARELLVLRMYFANKETLHDIVREAQLKAKEREQTTTSIFVPDNYGSWVRSCGRAKRSLSSVVLEEGMVEELLDDVCNFYESDNWYRERGIPWRRGYLLEGLPGCGKTSFIMALAGELSLDIYAINLSSKNLSDESLSELLANTPQRSLLLLEDVEAAASTKHRTSSVTRSGLLNAMDGVAAVEGRVLFMTSNCPGELDAAFLRPGRVDVRKHFRQATSYHAIEMFRKFFPDAPTHLADEFGRLFKDDIVNIATLQGYLMYHRHDPHLAVSDLDKLFSNSESYTIIPTTREEPTKTPPHAEDGAGIEE